jgi:hypothetical protein
LDTLGGFAERRLDVRVGLKAAFRQDESSPQRFRKNAAKRNWRQAFDNKGNREIADSAPSMIPEA